MAALRYEILATRTGHVHARWPADGWVVECCGRKLLGGGGKDIPFWHDDIGTVRVAGCRCSNCGEYRTVAGATLAMVTIEDRRRPSAVAVFGGGFRPVAEAPKDDGDPGRGQRV